MRVENVSAGDSIQPWSSRNYVAKLSVFRVRAINREIVAVVFNLFFLHIPHI